MSSIFSLSVRIIAWSTLIIWAMLAILTRSAWLLKMLSVHAGHQRVAQRVLLVEEAGIGARLDVVPGAPFVHDQADPSFADRTCP